MLLIYRSHLVILTRKHEVATTGQGDARDITAIVERDLTESGARDGAVTVFVVGSTAGVTTIEFEAGAVHDLDRAFEALAPRGGEYQHHLRWGDDNGSSHVRAALLGPSVVVPFQEGRLLLGTWQQLVLIEFDTRPRRRELVVQIAAE